MQYLYQQASAARARRQPRLRLERRGAFLSATFVYIFSYFVACFIHCCWYFLYYFDYIHTYVYIFFVFFSFACVIHFVAYASLLKITKLRAASEAFKGGGVEWHTYKCVCLYL